MNTGGPTPSPGFNVPPPPAMSGTPGAVSAAAASGIAYPPALQKWIRRCLAAAANNKQELGTVSYLFSSNKFVFSFSILISCLLSAGLSP